jgi:hypothetical protein
MRQDERHAADYTPSAKENIQAQFPVRAVQQSLFRY